MNFCWLTMSADKIAWEKSALFSAQTINFYRSNFVSKLQIQQHFFNNFLFVFTSLIDYFLSFVSLIPQSRLVPRTN